MQGEVAVSMSRPHLTSLRCGTGASVLSAILTVQVVVTTHLDITTASRTPEFSVLLGLNITSAKARLREVSLLRAQPLCTNNAVREQKKKRNHHLPSQWGGYLLRRNLVQECCLLVGHYLHPIQTKNCKNFLQLHNSYHTFKYCTNAKAELTSLKEGELINIKDIKELLQNLENKK